jgi:hypothetical protein
LRRLRRDEEAVRDMVWFLAFMHGGRPRRRLKWAGRPRRRF